MSGYIVGRVLWADLPAHLKLTAVIIADAANDEGYSYPGLSRIAAQLGQGERQARYNITELKERGILTTHARGNPGGGRSSNGYQFNLEVLPYPPKANRQPVAALGGQTGNPAQANRQPIAALNRQSSAGKPAIAIAGDPSEDPSGEEKRRAPASRGSRLTLTALPDEWKTWAQTERPDLNPVATWDAFADYWRAKPGKDGLKLDWLATWRNWVRRERAAGPGPGQGQYRAAGPVPSGPAYAELRFED